MFKKEQLKNISAVWIVPIIAVLIGIILLFDHYSQIGKTIYLLANSADGIKEGKTEIKYHSVSIGKVVKVSLSEDLNKVIIKATMNKEANKLLVDDSKFWLIRPRINTQGISGLDTLITGMYIELYPGKSIKEKTKFNLVDEIVMIGNQTEGKYINLIDTTSESKLQTGQPITYHGYEVGTIVSSKLSVESRRMEYVGFIYSPYDNLVTTNSKFWFSSTIDLSFGNKGFNLQVGSIDTFIKGGVTFDVPHNKKLGSPIKNKATFNIYKNENSLEEQEYKEHIDYVVMLPTYVNDLLPGSSVEFSGIQIGVVSDKNVQGKDIFENIKNKKIPIVISIQKERVDPNNELSFEEFKHNLDQYHKKGVVASIEQTSILAGSSYVSLKLDTNSSSRKLETYNGMYIIPGSTPSASSIPSKIESLLDNINKIDFKKIESNLNKTLSSLESTIKELNKLSKNLVKITDNNEQKSLLNNINKSLNQLQKTLDSYSENSTIYYELSSTIKSIKDLVKSVNPIIQKTNENPNRYIFNNDTDDDTPKASNTR